MIRPWEGGDRSYRPAPFKYAPAIWEIKKSQKTFSVYFMVLKNKGRVTETTEKKKKKPYMLY